MDLLRICGSFISSGHGTWRGGGFLPTFCPYGTGWEGTEFADLLCVDSATEVAGTLFFIRCMACSNISSLAQRDTLM